MNRADALATTALGFLNANRPWRFAFPRDHAAHDGIPIEDIHRMLDVARRHGVSAHRPTLSASR